VIANLLPDPKHRPLTSLSNVNKREKEYREREYRNRDNRNREGVERVCRKRV
jgi:hypothetical protein